MKKRIITKIGITLGLCLLVQIAGINLLSKGSSSMGAFLGVWVLLVLSLAVSMIVIEGELKKIIK
jgi:hypothetical protein